MVRLVLKKNRPKVTPDKNFAVFHLRVLRVLKIFGDMLNTGL